MYKFHTITVLDLATVFKHKIKWFHLSSSYTFVFFMFYYFFIFLTLYCNFIFNVRTFLLPFVPGCYNEMLLFLLDRSVDIL